MTRSQHSDSRDQITAQHHYHVRFTVFLITLPLSLPLYWCGEAGVWRIDIVVTKLPWWECVYSVHRYHYYHHTIIRSDTAEISIYTVRRDALCALTNNCEDNEYIQVFMVNVIILILTPPLQTFHPLMPLNHFTEHMHYNTQNTTCTVVMICVKLWLLHVMYTIVELRLPP